MWNTHLHVSVLQTGHIWFQHHFPLVHQFCYIWWLHKLCSEREWERDHVTHSQRTQNVLCVILYCMLGEWQSKTIKRCSCLCQGNPNNYYVAWCWKYKTKGCGQISRCHAHSISLPWIQEMRGEDLATLLLSVFLTLLIAVMFSFIRKCCAISKVQSTTHVSRRAIRKLVSV